MKIILPTLFVIFALVLAACGGATPQPLPDSVETPPAAQPTAAQATTRPTDPPAPTVTPAVDPLEIAVSVDEDAFVEALIPLEGGTLSLQAQDGTRFTLDIPADALEAPALVRMTAVEQVSGLPFGSPASYVVELTPEGLSFYNFATLTIEPAEEIALEEQIFFGYQQGGKDVFLAPPVVDARAMQILLMHFSGYGVTKGFLADVAPVQAQLGGSDETRIGSQIAAILQRERQRQLLGGGEDSDALWAQLEPLWQEYYQKVVAVRLAAAGQSCAAGRLAIQTALSLLRQTELLGGDSDQYNIDLAALMDTAGRVCLQEEYELCTEQHIIHRMIPVWISFMRQGQLLGSDTPEEPGPLAEEARRLTEACLTFDLEYESSGTSMDQSLGYDGAVEALVPLRFDSSELKIHGSGPLVPIRDIIYMEGCTVNHSAEEGTFEVFSMTYDTDLNEAKEAAAGAGVGAAAGAAQASRPVSGIVPGKTEKLGKVVKINMNYFPGVTAGPFSVTCDDFTLNQGPGSAWWSIYLLAHQDEIIGQTTSLNFWADDWTIHGGELFAERNWQAQDVYTETFEQGTMKLYHRPGK